MTEGADRLLAATTRIVTAWLAASSVASSALPVPVRDIHRWMVTLGRVASLRHRWSDCPTSGEP